MYVDIGELFQKKEVRYILIAGLFLAVCGLIIWMFTRKDQEDTYHVVPLETVENGNHGWDKVNFGSGIDDPEEFRLNAYRLSEVDIDFVRELVEDLGFSESSEMVGEDGRFYSWENQRDMAMYDSITRHLTVNSSGIRLSRVEGSYLTLDSAVDHFNDFAAEYLNLGLATSVTAERRGDVYEVHGNWLIDGYPVVGAFNQEYTIITQFDETGGLVSMSVDLVSVSPPDSTVELISVADVSSYIQSGVYPKEAYINVSASSESGCSLEGCIDYEYGVVEGFSEAEIAEARVVYYYAPLKTQEVLPVYRLKGTATVSGEESELATADVTIYANAIDPSRIIIESEE